MSGPFLQPADGGMPSGGSTGQMLVKNSATDGDAAWTGVAGALGITIDGGATSPSTGSKGYLQLPYNCMITGWTIAADQSGSAQITVKHSTDAGFPTTSSIVASLPPKLVSQQKNESTTLTGWTTSLAAGDWLEFNLDSVSSCQRIFLKLAVIRS